MREIVNKHKAPKDTILNNILQEIDEENGIVSDVPSEKNQKKVLSEKKQKRSWLGLFFSFMLMVIVLFVLFVIYIITMASTEETSTKRLNTPSPQQIVVPIKVSKPIEKSIININLLENKSPKVVHVKKVQKAKDIPHTKHVPLPKETEEALIREKAKAALMEQMKN